MSDEAEVKDEYARGGIVTGPSPRISVVHVGYCRGANPLYSIGGELPEHIYRRSETACDHCHDDVWKAQRQ